MSSYATIEIPCKPYIKKFATALFGEPVCAVTETSLGFVLQLSLTKNLYENRHYRENEIASYKKQRPDTLTISVNKWTFDRIGNDVSIETIIHVNRYLERIFTETLYLYVNTRLRDNAKEKGYQLAIIDFTIRYNIQDEDISFEGLKRQEYRYRKALEKRKKS